jgi:hypothetical protein
MGDAKRRALIAILLVAPIQTATLLISHFSNAGWVGQTTFITSKIWLLTIPLWWHLKVDGKKRSWSIPHHGGWKVASLLGIGMAGVILGAWFLIGTWAVDAEAIRVQWGVFGLTDWRILLAACFYWIFLNSVLEEIVFRWFITTRVETLVGSEIKWRTMAITAAIFTLHHTVALLFSVALWLVILGTIAIFIAGLIFSWVFLKYRSIWVVWLCHAIADVGLFIVIGIIMLG